MNNFLSNRRITRNFTYGEFRCPHCGENRIDIGLVERLQEARNFSNTIGSGIAYHINSGFRCPIHNEAVGGKANSAHLEGLAADIRVEGTYDRMCIIYGLVKAGFTRVGDYATFFHVDMRSRITMWRE